MSGFELPTRTAMTLDDAWVNFDPQVPLPPHHPFYVERSDNPLYVPCLVVRRQDKGQFP